MIDIANWAWPQWTLASLLAVNLLLSAHLHGKPREPNSFWTSIIGLGIILPILYFGGFFA